MNDYPQSQPPYDSTPPRTRTWLWVILLVIIACLVISLPLAALLGIGWLSYSTVQNMQATTTARTQVALTAQAMLAAPPEDWTAAIEDAFSRDDTGVWGTGTTEHDWVTAKRTIVDGEYQWRLLTKEGGCWWETYEYQSARHIDDLYMSVDVHSVGGSDTTVYDYGLMFRFANSDNFYVFVVSEDQFAAVLMLWSNEWERLVPWTYSDAIQVGGVNHLAVLAQDTHYWFFVNDQLVAELDDDHIDSGKVGLFASFTDYARSVYINFDNFEVYRP